MGRELTAPKVATPCRMPLSASFIEAGRPFIPTTLKSSTRFRTSVRNNRRSNLTGCLAHPDGHFVQVIEGEPGHVASLMDRLRRDTRHTDVEILGEWPAPSRLFSAWAMARPDLRPIAEQSFRLINEKGTGSQVTAILLGLVNTGTSLYPLI